MANTALEAEEVSAAPTIPENATHDSESMLAEPPPDDPAWANLGALVEAVHESGIGTTVVEETAKPEAEEPPVLADAAEGPTGPEPPAPPADDVPPGTTRARVRESVMFEGRRWMPGDVACFPTFDVVAMPAHFEIL